MLSASAEGSAQQRELQRELRVRFGRSIDQVEQFLHTENDHGNFPHFNVRFTRRGETLVRVGQFKGTNPGVAYLRCAQKNPGCTLVGAWLGAEPGTKGGNQGRITYEPASTIKVLNASETGEEISRFEKRDRDATTSILQHQSHAAETDGKEPVPKHHARRRRWITGTFPAVDAALTNGES